MYILDSHCDTPSQVQRLRDLSLDNDHAHVDLPKLKKGRVDGVFFALYTPASFEQQKAYAHAWELLNLTKKTVDLNPNEVVLATSPSECLEAQKSGKVAICIGMENGSPIGQELALIDEFYSAGVRYLTLCHSRDNDICDSCAQGTTWHGLSPFGKALVAHLNEIGMIIDVSHISDESFYDVLKYSSKPVVATHSCCRALAGHKRNMTDDMIRALALKGGVIQINFYPTFLDDDFAAMQASEPLFEAADAAEEAFIAAPWSAPAREAWYKAQDALNALQRPSYKRIADHVDHVVRLVGVDHVGLGSDFDGIAVAPEGMEDCSKFPLILDELRSRGYSEADVEKIAGGNFLRVWEEVCSTNKN